MGKIHLTLLVCLLFCKQQFAQCPPLANAKQFADTATVAEFLPIIEKYANCPDSRDSLGYLYQRLTVAHFKTGDLLQAITTAEKAVVTREKALPKNHPDIAYSLYTLGALNTKTSNNEAAESAFKKAIQILLVGGSSDADTRKTIKAHLELSKLRHKIGDYGNALDLSAVALSQSKQLADQKLLADAYVVQSEIFLEKKEHPAAVGQATKAIKLYENLASPHVSNLAAAYINQGIGYYELKSFDKALGSYTTALGHAEEKGMTAKVCFCYNNIGLVYKKMGNPAKAEDYFNQIIQDTSLGCNRSAYNNLGDLAGQNDFQAANEYYEKAVLAIAGKGGELVLETIADTLSRINNKEYLLDYMHDLARHQATSPRYQRNALALYRLLDRLSDAMREEHYNPNSKLFWRDEVHPIYEEAIALCLRLEKVEDAFYFSEKSKAVLLYDRVSENLLQVHLADSLQQQLNSNNQQIAYLENKEKRNAKEESRLLALKGKKENLLADIKQYYPEFFQLKYQALNLSIQDAIDLLPDEETAMMEFFYGGNVLYTFKIDKKNGLEAWQVPIDSLFRQDLLQFTTLFREKGGRNLLYQPEKYGRLAHALYAKLVPNDLLDNYEKLLLIPDGYLNYLPFDALLKEATVVESFSDLPYLGRSLAISYAYSLPILSLQKAAKKQVAKRKVLAIFPEFSQGENGQVPLANSPEELSGVQANFPHKTLRSAAASRQNFQQHAPNYQIIHLASHASGGTDSLTPSIEFIDSSFLLPSLFSLDLNCDLVVLSSCETGMGQYAAGEGVMSLARGFTYAGANSLVSTLWKVNDASTAKIMAHFYRHLAAGKPKAQALHLAKLDYLNDPAVNAMQKSPYFWAGFVYVGNDTVVETVQSWRLGLLGGGFVLLLGMLFYMGTRTRLARPRE